MTTVESLLRALVEHRRRGLFVIILTCGLALLLVWPVVDEYFVLTEECAQLELSIAEAQQEALGADPLKKAAAGRAKELSELREATMVVSDVHEFSSKLVELTRSKGCQLRKVDLGDAQKRKWSEQDHPLSPPASTAQTKETPFELRTQKVALSVSGPLDRVQELLQELHGMGKLVHTQSLQLKPTDDTRREVNLDLELLFFDLKRVKKNPTT
jgi:hypothetical protein